MATTTMLSLFTPAVATALLADSILFAYGPLGIMILVAVFTGLLIIGLSAIIGPGRGGKTKGIVYESGMNPLSSARRRFNVRFYVVAMTFLVFDVEIVFLYPWATVFPSLSAESGLTPLFLGRMLFFVLTSVIAFAYAWRKGVFRYD